MRKILPLVAVLTLLGCDPGTEPEVADVAGSYEATTLTTTDNGETTDHLAAGSSIAIVLQEGGTTTGRMYIVGGEEDGSDLDVDLAGTWSLRGDMVELSHGADTFLRNTGLRYSAGRLTGSVSFVFGGQGVDVVLTKQ